MNSLLIQLPLFAGILASMLHVLSGPDHLAAVTPLAIESKRKSWIIGAFWGLGHLAGMLLIGLLFSAFRSFIPVEKISQYSEQIVGFVLIGIGSWAIFRIFKHSQHHKHPHFHENDEPFIHVHEHDHHDIDVHSHPHSHKVKSAKVSALLIGILHGLAGVSHFLLLLPTLAFNSMRATVYYLIGFGVGTVISMTAFALVLGYLAEKTDRGHDDMLFKGIRFAGGLFAIAIGVYWMTL